VNIQRTPEAKPKKENDDAGFLPGLKGGWNALVVFGVALATVAGALLPWTVVLLLVGGPLWLVVRRLRRRTPVPAPAPATVSD
jgi:Flp pilus assembly protein TadB